ncbi:MAG: hypothetical protein AAGD05_03725 [Bacteroidota bacterium]
MSTDKALLLNTSAIFRSVYSTYETQNELPLEQQAFIFNFEHHFKATSKQ